MSDVVRIKMETAELSPDEQVELFRWWVDSQAFKQWQLAALKRDIAIGVEQLNRGRYQTYNDANVMELAEDVTRSGRERLNMGRKHSET